MQDGKMQLNGIGQGKIRLDKRWKKQSQITDRDEQTNRDANRRCFKNKQR